MPLDEEVPTNEEKNAPLKQRKKSTPNCTQIKLRLKTATSSSPRFVSYTYGIQADRWNGRHEPV